MFKMLQRWWILGSTSSPSRGNKTKQAYIDKGPYLRFDFTKLGCCCCFFQHGDIFHRFSGVHNRVNQLLPKAEVFDIPIRQRTFHTQLHLRKVVPAQVQSRWGNLEAQCNIEPLPAFKGPSFYHQPGSVHPVKLARVSIRYYCKTHREPPQNVSI